MTTNRPLRVAIIGAGPAGTYAADILTKQGLDVSIDIIERLPAPFGLVRYGVAPDHPRIKQIIVALANVLGRGDIRLLANVNIGTDLTLDDLREHYDAVIFATGSFYDADLNIPGIDLEGSYGAADFVSWYDGHPDVPRTWPLDGPEVAVFGVGNVALDVARMLAKHPKDLLPTEIPANVYEGLEESPVTDVHIFGRRGPAQVKFSPLELRELGHVPDVDIIVYPEDYDFDEGSMAAVEANHQTKQVVKTLTDWTLREPTGASRRIHLHFLQSPHEVLGEDGQGLGRSRGAHALTGDGNARGHGRVHRLPGAGGVPRCWLLGQRDRGRPVQQRQGRDPQRRGSRDRRRGRARSRVLRDRLDQARPRRPHRPHQVRRRGDHFPRRRGRRALYADTRAGAEQLSPDNILRLLASAAFPLCSGASGKCSTPTSARSAPRRVASASRSSRARR